MITIAHRAAALWRNLFRRADVDRSLDAELTEYVELLAAEHQRAGLPAAEARRAALVEVGGVTQVREATREAWTGRHLASAMRELRYAMRTLRRAPTFLAIAVLTLAIGVGGSTAVFTVIKASLLRPLPAVADPDRLVTIETVQPGSDYPALSLPDYLDVRSQAKTLSGLAGYDGSSMILEDSTGSSTREWVSFVTDDFFTTLGVRAAAGRFFNRDTRETEPVAVIGHALWMRRYGASNAVIGARIRLNERSYRVIGVAAPRFIGGMATHVMEVFVQGAPGDIGAAGLAAGSRRVGDFRVTGRLAPGRTIDDAQTELSTIAARLERAYPETNTKRMLAVFARIGMTAEEREDASRVPRLLTIAVGVLLLIACGNVASLTLVRAAARRRELATRIALGASRAALVRQVALEGALVAVGAGALGLVIARLLVRSATIVGSVIRMSDLDLALDGRVLAVALLSSTATAILVAALPAVEVLRLSPGAVLKDGAGAGRRSRGQRGLVIAQVGASLVMLTASAMIYASFNRVLGAHATFNPKGLSDVGLNVRLAIPDTVRQLAFYRELLTRAKEIPGVKDAALATTIPPFQYAARGYVFRRGEAPPEGASAKQIAATGTRVGLVSVSDSYFRVGQIPLIAGRTFTVADDPRSERVAIVSRRLASVMWPGRSAIGQAIVWPDNRPAATVVGVAEDTRDPTLAGEPPLNLYLPFTQWRHTAGLSLLLRTDDGVAVPQVSIAGAIAAIDPRVAVYGQRTLEDRLQSEVRPQRMASAWVGVFGAIALLLAAIGLYGVIAQSVLQRTRELAVRSALGATPGRILSMVLGQGMWLVALGAVLGAIAAAIGTRGLRSMFSGIEVADPRPMIGAVLVLSVAMLLAAFIPARRAARLNPAEALRSD